MTVKSKASVTAQGTEISTGTSLHCRIVTKRPQRTALRKGFTAKLSAARGRDTVKQLAVSKHIVRDDHDCCRRFDDAELPAILPSIRPDEPDAWLHANMTQTRYTCKSPFRDFFLWVHRYMDGKRDGINGTPFWEFLRGWDFTGRHKARRLCSLAGLPTVADCQAPSLQRALLNSTFAHCVAMTDIWLRHD